MKYNLEFALLGDECGFAVVDHDRHLANYCSPTTAIREGLSDRSKWRKFAVSLIDEEAHWLATGAPRTSYQEASGWLAYAANQGVSTQTAVI